VFPSTGKEDCDLTFHSIPYSMGSKGMYLTLWTLNFNLEEEISSTLVWVKLPHLPLIFWDDVSLKYIGNWLGTFINKAKRKYVLLWMYMCGG